MVAGIHYALATGEGEPLPAAPGDIPGDCHDELKQFWAERTSGRVLGVPVCSPALAVEGVDALHAGRLASELRAYPVLDLTDGSYVAVCSVGPLRGLVVGPCYHDHEPAPLELSLGCFFERCERLGGVDAALQPALDLAPRLDAAQRAEARRWIAGDDGTINSPHLVALHLLGAGDEDVVEPLLFSTDDSTRGLAWKVLARAGTAKAEALVDAANERAAAYAKDLTTHRLGFSFTADVERGHLMCVRDDGESCLLRLSICMTWGSTEASARSVRDAAQSMLNRRAEVMARQAEEDARLDEPPPRQGLLATMKELFRRRG